jgi:hypothetical protein
MRSFKRRRYKSTPAPFIPMVIAIILLLLLGSLFLSTPKQKASKVVSTFYTYEQRGDFVTSWSYLHSSMQAKFQQSDYIQDRDKIFMGNFGVETFNFTTGKAKKVRNWVYSEYSPPLKTAYRITVIQNYETKYGNFAIHQQVFAVKENGRWKVLWDFYKQVE